jgi:hypothetical protein
LKAERRIISKRCILQYIPVDIFRASFKFFMGDKLREKMKGGKRVERFSVHFTVQTPLQIVFLNNLKIVGPLSKIKPCTRRGPKIGKKTLESCDVSFHHMNFIEPPGKLGILLSVATLQTPNFSLRSSCAATTERLLEIIPYRTEERGGGCLPVITTIPFPPFPLKRLPLLCTTIEVKKARGVTLIGTLFCLLVEERFVL